MADIDPGYGGYATTNKLLGAASNSPAQFGQTLDNARGSVALSQQQFELGQKQLGALNEVLGSVLADPSPQNATARLSDAIHSGIIPPDVGARELQKITSYGGDPTQPNQTIQQDAFRHLQLNATYADKLSAARMAPPQMVSNGQSLVPIQTSGGPDAGATVLGSGQPNAPIPLHPSPEFQQSPASIQTPAGTTIQTNMANRNATIAAQGGGIVGPAPGTIEAKNVTGQASAEQGVNLQHAADGAPVRKAMLANLNDDLDKFTSGPGADWQQVGKAWANRNVLPQSMQFDPQSIASQESFNKQATQLAQQQFTALGGTGTDQQLSSSFKANPNQALSQLGNRQIIQLLQGNEDALAAKASAWQKWAADPNKGPATYGAFQQDFNKNYNPRVYQAMYMTPDQIDAMRKNMSKAQQQQFANDYKALKDKGYITPGGVSGQ